jgi:biopolymer transport protein ExbB
MACPSDTCPPRSLRALAPVLLAFLLGCAAVDLAAQDEPAGPAPATGGAAPSGTASEPATTAVRPARAVEDINLLTLLVRGGPLMIPIGFMSLVVVTFTIERFLSLRRNRVLPVGLIDALGSLGNAQRPFDPREAYRTCQQFPSAAASVIRAMLLKVGRPHSEVEHTVTEVSQREAERLYANVRWLNLAAAVTPLLGLLGTVQGMIWAFHRTTQLAPGQDRADELASGIYIALVTTFSGLAVAIPAVIFAYYFEGRIQNLFHRIDELLFNLMPQIERYEGRVRFTQPAEEAEPRAPSGSEGVAPPPAPAGTR